MEKRLFGTICEEALTAAFKYTLCSGLQCVIMYSLLSPCVEVVEKLEGAELKELVTSAVHLTKGF